MGPLGHLATHKYDLQNRVLMSGSTFGFLQSWCYQFKLWSISVRDLESFKLMQRVFRKVEPPMNTLDFDFWTIMAEPFIDWHYHYPGIAARCMEGFFTIITNEHIQYIFWMTTRFTWLGWVAIPTNSQNFKKLLTPQYRNACNHYPLVWHDLCIPKNDTY